LPEVGLLFVFRRLYCSDIKTAIRVVGGSCADPIGHRRKILISKHHRWLKFQRETITWKSTKVKHFACMDFPAKTLIASIIG
jgi:hypothetical protein